MKENLFFYCDAPFDRLKKAYMDVLRKYYDSIQEFDKRIVISWKMHFGYNMNAGSCTIRFKEMSLMTAVAFSYKLFQLLGAQCRKHASKINNEVADLLGANFDETILSLGEFLS